LTVRRIAAEILDRIGQRERLTGEHMAGLARVGPGCGNGRDLQVRRRPEVNRQGRGLDVVPFALEFRDGSHRTAAAEAGNIDGS
jgi:hypothetical protein